MANTAKASDERWVVLASADKGSTPIPIGTAGDSLPSAFTAMITYPDDQLKVTLRASFAGDRVAVRSVTIEPTEGIETVAPRSLTRLQLASVVQAACLTLVKPGYGLPGDRKGAAQVIFDRVDRVAALYAYAYASWGDPRKAVATELGLPRTTVTRWIHRAAERHTIPGPHAKES